MKKLLFFFSLFFNCAYSQNITQPIGILVQTWNDPTAVNDILMQWNNTITLQTIPFDLNFPVTETVLTTSQHFVRLYAPTSGSGPNGFWITRAEYVRGKTPEQLKEELALPAIPTHIVNVSLPPSSALWTGIVAPILGYGKGGAVQYRIIADTHGTHYFPQYPLIIGKRDHPQKIGKHALSYQRMIRKGNARKVAAYLDSFVPKAYSDLENIYTLLDHLNWVHSGPKPLSHALKQISPKCYEILSFLSWRNDLLFSNSVLEQDLQCQPSIKGFGEFITAKKANSISFKNYTGGGMASFNHQLLENFSLGVAIAGFHNNLFWNHSQNCKFQLTTTRLGIYANYFANSFWCISSLLTGGYSRSKVQRPITFSILNRKAHSKPSSYDMAFHLNTKLFFPSKLGFIVPFGRLSYFLVQQNRFKEQGANSLNLKVRAFNTKILRSVWGIEFKNCGSVKIVPEAQLAWAQDFTLGHPKIHARLRELNDGFSIKNKSMTGSHLLLSTSLRVQIFNNLFSLLKYDTEWSRYFTSHQVKLDFHGNF